MAVVWKRLAYAGDAPAAHEASHVSGGSDDIDSALAPIAIALTTRGDTVYQDASGLQRLAKGNENDVLTMGANEPAWSAPAGGAELSDTAPNTIQPDDAASAGSGTEASRDDHEHGIVAAAPSTVGSANSEGNSTSFARANHIHQREHTKYTDANARTAAVEDAVYGAGWNGDTTHAPSQNAVWDKIESLGGAGASLTVAETEVFSGTSPSAWTDLNLSGTIGAQVSLVMLKLHYPAAGPNTMVFRKNGDTDEYFQFGFFEASGVVHFHGTRSGIVYITIVATDSSGIIEWKTEAAKALTTIDVVAYIK